MSDMTGVPVLPTLPPKVRNQNTAQQSWEADRKMWGAYAKMDWFKNQELEPIMPHNSTSILAQWLNEVDEGKVWECCVPSDTAKTWCDHKPLKRFDRALAHVRTHLGLKPFPCEGRCEVNGCQERFNSSENRGAHWRGPDNQVCDSCGAEVLRQNLARHQAKCS